MQGNMLCLSNFFLISLCLEDYIFGVFFCCLGLGFFGVFFVFITFQFSFLLSTCV